MALPGRLTPGDETSPEPGQAVPARPGWLEAVRRGLLGRCPACGQGRLFGRFLKVCDRCEACEQDLHHHRADDLPPYLVIFVVGHAVAYGVLVAELDYEAPLWFHLAVWPALTVALALLLMQPFKGAVVGLQYAFGMHGFSSPDQTDPPH